MFQEPIPGENTPEDPRLSAIKDKEYLKRERQEEALLALKIQMQIRLAERSGMEFMAWVEEGGGINAKRFAEMWNNDPDLRKMALEDQEGALTELEKRLAH